MTPELVTAISSVVIAVLALVVTVYQSVLTRKHNRQTVRPVLQLRCGFRLGEIAGLHLANVGLGPAVIRSSAVSVDGRHLGSFDKKTVDVLRGDQRPRPSASTLNEVAVLPAGYTEHLLQVDDFDPDLAWHAEFATLVTRTLSLEITYDSLYGGEQFVARWHDGKATESPV
jgi:hypothetical protein